jgi:hypothetical protein
VTVVTAGRIFSAGFPLGHFTHVFVDEAGHAMEPETLICLAGNRFYWIESLSAGQCIQLFFNIKKRKILSELCIILNI